MNSSLVPPFVLALSVAFLGMFIGIAGYWLGFGDIYIDLFHACIGIAIFTLAVPPVIGFVWWLCRYVRKAFK